MHDGDFEELNYHTLANRVDALEELLEQFDSDISELFDHVNETFRELEERIEELRAEVEANE